MPDSDQQNRELALDPSVSFIVEAPAGSGKTELLTQRFLRLLSTVELPEQLVAVTFTRKAAAEMRQRVIETLRAAVTPDQPVAEHRRVAVSLAGDVIRHSRHQGWPLPAQAQRLRILTVDSLNASLARQMPVSSGGIAAADLTDRAESLYRLAARRTTEALDDDDDLGRGLRHMLRSLDNRLERLEDSLVDCLPQRDRWLRILSGASDEELAEHVQTAIAAIRKAQVQSLRQLAGASLEHQLAALLDAVARSSVLEANPASADPAANEKRVAEPVWDHAANLLLTKEGRWRKRFTRREGFPPDAKGLKESLAQVLADLQAIPEMEEKLAALQALPDSSLDSGQRAFLQSLGPVLKRLLAELRLVFAELEIVDHPEMALAASDSLGTSDMPSDLLLALDRRIEHLLVDEFQDTSHVQWRLLEQLTEGWEQGDGRSLFLVGDPMQSIYRFRDADVSLFLRARESGLGQVRLRHLRLSSNYRSAPAIVDWVNDAFMAILAKDGETGGSSTSGHYARAKAARPADESAGVDVKLLAGDDEQAETIALTNIVQSEMNSRPDQSLAILVRSRSHLLGVRSALASAGIPVRAVEIDSLVDTQPGLDLISFSSALLHPGDRFSWLSLLRGPCCGMSWADLHELCRNSDGEVIPALLADTDRQARLSSTGQKLAAWMVDWLLDAESLRLDLSAGQWLKQAWYLLDGPASVVDAESLALAETYFADVDQLAEWGDLDDPAQLREWFSRPGQGHSAGSAGVEIMTMHRAKGLEFDVVILPSLSRSVRGNEHKLLISETIDLGVDQSFSLVAEASRKDDKLAGWLRQRERDHDWAERIRLLYVATTRARRRLFLVGRCAPGSEPKAGSLLSALWPVVGSDMAMEAAANHGRGAGFEVDGTANDIEQSGDSMFIEARLRRLVPAEKPGDWFTPRRRHSIDDPSARPEFEWVHPASVQVGTIIHSELQHIAVAAQERGELRIGQINRSACRRELALLGVDEEDLDQALARVEEALRLIAADPVAQWILAPRNEAWSEQRLSIRSGGRIEHLQLDRSFVDDDGSRWVIDYKTGRHLGADVEGFLEAEVERYRDQLNAYARAVAAIDARPVRAGLYFPLMSEFRDWVPET